jgi:hypothetical protein
MTPTSYMILRSALASARSYLASGRPAMADRVVLDAYNFVTAKQREEHPEPEAKAS